MYALGIDRGCGDGTDRRPGKAVTRQQIASFLARTFDASAGAGTDVFFDDDGSFHELNIDKLRYAKVTRGCGTLRFCPQTS